MFHSILYIYYLETYFIYGFFCTGMAADGGQDLITLTTDKLSADGVSESVTCPSCGAVSLFIGQSSLRCILMDHCFCLELVFFQ